MQSVMKTVLDVDSGNNQIVFALIFLELFLIDWVLSITGAKRVKNLSIIGPSCEGSDSHSQFICVLDGQMSKTSDPNNRASCSSFGVSLDGSVDSNSCTQERGNLMQPIMESLRDLDSPIMVNL